MAKKKTTKSVSAKPINAWVCVDKHGDMVLSSVRETEKESVIAVGIHAHIFNCIQVTITPNRKGKK